MRNKFTELIEQGVAAFNYTPIAPEMPEQDPICRMYNNIWSIPSDTHMHLDRETGIRYITGHMVGIQEQWNKFVSACHWGAVCFKGSGFWSLSNFLACNGLYGKLSVLNGDAVYEISPCDTENTACPYPDCPTCCITSESQIPINSAVLTINGDRLKLVECFTGKSNIYDIAKAMNESIYVKGNDWTPVDNKLMCPIGNKTYIL